MASGRSRNGNGNERCDVDDTLRTNMFRCDIYVSPNMIIGAMDVEARRSMDERVWILWFQSGSLWSDCTLSAQGFMLFEGKRLNPHFFFNVLDGERRSQFDAAFTKLTRDEVRGPWLRMETFEYPSSAELQGITFALIPQLEAKCSSMVRGLSEHQRSCILKRYGMCWVCGDLRKFAKISNILMIS